MYRQHLILEASTPVRTYLTVGPRIVLHASALELHVPRSLATMSKLVSEKDAAVSHESPESFESVEESEDETNAEEFMHEAKRRKGVSWFDEKKSGERSYGRYRSRNTEEDETEEMMKEKWYADERRKFSEDIRSGRRKEYRTSEDTMRYMKKVSADWDITEEEG